MFKHRPLIHQQNQRKQTRHIKQINKSSCPSLSADECKITTEDPEKSSKAQEKISAEYEGDPIVIGYNAEYLKDVVSHVGGDEVVVELSSAVSAALFSSLQTEAQVESIMLLMPIRLND